MACSRYEYVKRFEQHATLLPGCWAVVRLDGRGFTRFCADHGYAKPNDPAGLALMNDAAARVLADLPDLLLAFGHSDEFSFVLRRASALFARRHDKILSVTATLFAAEFVRRWPHRFPHTPLRRPPAFDARVVLYPTTAHLRDYLAWRQADVHVNNLFNTAFWALVRAGRTHVEAERDLRGTSAAQKNELLHAHHAINYNDEPALFRKGSILLRRAEDHPTAADHTPPAQRNIHRSPPPPPPSSSPDQYAESSSDTCHTSTVQSQHPPTGNNHNNNNNNHQPLVNDAAEKNAAPPPSDPHHLQLCDDTKSLIRTLHVDIIGDHFWTSRPHLLQPSDDRPPRG